MYLNVCVCDEFLGCQKWQKIKFWTFQAQPASVRVISSIFVCKCTFRKISKIKIIILDQSTPKIANFENRIIKT